MNLHKYSIYTFQQLKCYFFENFDLRMTVDLTHFLRIKCRLIQAQPELCIIYIYYFIYIYFQYI